MPLEWHDRFLAKAAADARVKVDLPEDDQKAQDIHRRFHGLSCKSFHESALF